LSAAVAGAAFTNYNLIEVFCANLSLAPRGHSVRRNDIEYRVFCFSDPQHAASFKAVFGGEDFDPKKRGRGGRWFEWR